jgi:hypothetical protein
MNDIDQLENFKENIALEIEHWKAEIKKVQENTNFGDSYKSETIKQLKILIHTREQETPYFDDLIKQVKNVLGIKA